MAKYERSLTGDFDGFLNHIHSAITQGSVSASFEDGSDRMLGQTRLAVRVYERYSMAGGNRVSLNISVLGHDNQLFVSAITSGGSQALFFKINTLGESAFLDQCIDAVERFAARA
ncbi:MAG: hypothetical protein GX112_10855 [Clostridiaceae bacterium]|jgi:hypothetical protein|nr:hypothetical protein [Clostridiaceae bacterium]